MAEAIRKAIQMKKSSLMRTGLTLTLTLALIFVGFYVVTSDTLGWFSANKQVSADGMSIMTKDYTIDVEFFYRSKATDAIFKTAELYVADSTATNGYRLPTVEERILESREFYRYDEGYVLAFDKEGFMPVTSWTDVFNTMQPKDTVHVKARYSNHESETYYGTSSFVFGDDPELEEKPMVQVVSFTTADPARLVLDENGQRRGKVTDNKDADGNIISYTQTFNEYYYLGSQLYVSASWTGTHENRAANENKNHRYFVDNDEGKVCFFDPLVYAPNDPNTNDFKPVPLVEDFELPPATTTEADGTTVTTPGQTTIYFEITFLSLEDNQNNYKFRNFNSGENPGSCIRHFLTDFSTTPPTQEPTN